jgi:hypothetical protein
MPTGTSPRRQLARAEIAWALLAFLALQLTFTLALDLGQPALYDAEYNARLRLLRDRIREGPGRPLLLVVGSSRIGAGFIAGDLPPLRSADGREVLPFNFSHLAAGPLLNLMQVRRLLREGITPSWLVLEVVPGHLAHERPPAELAALRDVPVLCRHASWKEILLVYARCRLNPFFKQRRATLSRFLPPLVTRAHQSDDVRLLPLGDDDDWMRKENVSAELRTILKEQARDVYFARLQDLHIDPALDRATRELLELCRPRGIPVVLLLTPETKLFRSWCSAETERRLQDYLRRLRDEHGVAVVDARDWVSDEGFNDPHHLRLRGARVFTERLGREVLRPLVTRNNEER